ncbi:hypothetical protein ONS95_011043 [Cadophora gregata]|uniref:uncharacterized protein n=1 Tax=Cadophora gregata TaxID=51156 RepID=UPI0026DB118C|nr:uncharacterized protein ONS95_011043 [Cadophora gregata]KAK0119603.1 hypothetical protein ONS95_011043 [Cadophora gregata]
MERQAPLDAIKPKTPTYSFQTLRRCLHASFSVDDAQRKSPQWSTRHQDMNEVVVGLPVFQSNNISPAAGPSGEKGLFLLGSLGSLGSWRGLVAGLSSLETLYPVLLVFSLDPTA